MDVRRHRMLFFLLVAVIIAGTMFFLDRQINLEHVDPPFKKTSVSRLDIRRAFVLPLWQGLELKERRASLIEQFTSLHANQLMLDVSIQIRKANPVYLEYSSVVFKEIESLVSHIHNTGMEVCLNPHFTGATEILDDPEMASYVYPMYEEWIFSAAGAGADAIVIAPIELQEIVSASYLLGTIEDLNTSYAGSLFLHSGKQSINAIYLYYKHVRGFVVPQHALQSLQPTLDSLNEMDNRLIALVDLHEPSTSRSNVFEPFSQKEIQSRTIDVSGLSNCIQSVKQKPWFHGVVLPSPLSTREEEYDVSDYRELVLQWFKALKKLSTMRALNKGTVILH